MRQRGGCSFECTLPVTTAHTYLGRDPAAFIEAFLPLGEIHVPFRTVAQLVELSDVGA